MVMVMVMVTIRRRRGVVRGHRRAIDECCPEEDRFGHGLGRLVLCSALQTMTVYWEKMTFGEEL